MSQSFKVRVDGDDFEPGIIGRGTRQGFQLSPLLFNIYIQELMNEAVADSTDGEKVGGELLHSIRLADDQAMVASSEEDLQSMMEKVDETSE